MKTWNYHTNLRRRKKIRCWKLSTSNFAEHTYQSFESIIYKRLMEVITHHCSSAQYGFMKIKFTILQLLKSITMIYDATAEESILLLFDFSKTFDKINRRIMLKNLSLLGLDSNFYYIIKSYLTGKTQSVRIEDH